MLEKLQFAIFRASLIFWPLFPYTKYSLDIMHYMTKRIQTIFRCKKYVEVDD